MPPDGGTFAIAPAAEGLAPIFFHVVEVPQVVAVVTVAQDRWNERTRTDVERLLTDHVEHVAFLHQDRPGGAVVDGQGPPGVLATAVAALKAIGGWDECVPIVIEVSGMKIDVRLSWDGARWTAEIEESKP